MGQGRRGRDRWDMTGGKGRKRKGTEEKLKKWKRREGGDGDWNEGTGSD